MYPATITRQAPELGTPLYVMTIEGVAFARASDGDEIPPEALDALNKAAPEDWPVGVSQVLKASVGADSDDVDDTDDRGPQKVFVSIDLVTTREAAAQIKSDLRGAGIVELLDRITSYFSADLDVAPEDWEYVCAESADDSPETAGRIERPSP